MDTKRVAGVLTAFILGGSIFGSVQVQAAGGESLEQAVEIEKGQEYNGSLDYEKKTEWYRFQTSGLDAYYTINVTSSGENGVKITLFSDGNHTKSSGMVTGKQSSSNFSAKLEANKNYYLGVTNEEYTTGGKYTVSVSELVDDCGDTAASAKTVSMEAVTQGQIEAVGDKDVYKIVTGSSDIPVRAVFWNIASGNTIDFNVYSGKSLKSSQIVAKGANVRSGMSKNYDVVLKKKTTYYIVVKGNGVGSYQFGFLNLNNDFAKKTTTLQASKSGKNAVLRWNPIDYTQGYEVYVSDKKDGKYKLVASTTGKMSITTTVKNLKKGTYYYKVRGISAVQYAGSGKSKRLSTIFSNPVKVVIK